MNVYDDTLFLNAVYNVIYQQLTRNAIIHFYSEVNYCKSDIGIF